MIFKNITKKNIVILHGGQKIVIKPNQIVDGDKHIFEHYKGLLKINNPKLVIPKPVLLKQDINELPIVLPTQSNIIVDYIIEEDIN